MSKEEPFNYFESSGLYISLCAQIEHKLSMLIVYHKFGHDAMYNNTDEVKDFMRNVIYPDKKPLGFYDKIETVKNLLETDKFKEIRELCLIHFNPIHNVRRYRNDIAHGFFAINDDNKIVIVKPSLKTEDSKYVLKLKLVQHKKRIEQAQDIIRSLNASFKVLSAYHSIKNSTIRLESDKDSNSE